MNDQTYQSQLRRTRKAFADKPKTRLQVAIETGILRGNICYYVRDLKEANQLRVTRKGTCPISNHTAEFLSTDPNLFPSEDKE